MVDLITLFSLYVGKRDSVSERTVDIYAREREGRVDLECYVNVRHGLFNVFYYSKVIPG